MRGTRLYLVARAGEGTHYVRTHDEHFRIAGVHQRLGHTVALAVMGQLEHLRAGKIGRGATRVPAAAQVAGQQRAPAARLDAAGKAARVLDLIERAHRVALGGGIVHAAEGFKCRAAAVDLRCIHAEQADLAARPKFPEVRSCRALAYRYAARVHPGTDAREVLQTGGEQPQAQVVRTFGQRGLDGACGIHLRPAVDPEGTDRELLGRLDQAAQVVIMQMGADHAVDALHVLLVQEVCQPDGAGLVVGFVRAARAAVHDQTVRPVDQHDRLTVADA